MSKIKGPTIKPKIATSKNAHHNKAVVETKTVSPLLIIVICTFIAFIPVLSNQYVTYDDPEFIYKNPIVLNFSASNFFESIKAIFSGSVIGAYSPLVILSYCFEKAIFGIDHPFYWHLDNVLLHLLNVYLVFNICKQLKFSVVICVIASLLFGIQPMRVESVAWLTERKDMLYGAAYLGGLLMYARYLTDGFQKKHIRRVYLFFIIALFSKIQAVAFPLSLVLLDYYVNGKISRKTILEKLPFFLMSLCMGLAGIFLLKQNAVLESNTVVPLGSRLILAGMSILIYLAKSILPYRMLNFYPYPAVLNVSHYISILIVPALVLVLYYSWKQKRHVLVFGLLFFLSNVAFVLQILAAGQGYLSDRYTYLPYLGLFIIYGWLFERLWLAYPAQQNNLRIGVGICFFVYGIVTFQQNKIWENGATLWTHVLKYYDNLATPYYNRAIYYVEQGNFAKALPDYTRAIQIEKNNPELYEGRAKLYFEISGQDNEMLLRSLADCNKAISLKNNVAGFYGNRANVYGKLNKLDSALADANKSIALDPNYAQAYNTRSMIYNIQGKTNEAMQDRKTFLSLMPEAESAR